MNCSSTSGELMTTASATWAGRPTKLARAARLQLGLHRKPVALINVDGYFDPLLRWIHQAVDSGFVRPGQAHLLQAEGTPELALARLLAQHG